MEQTSAGPPFKASGLAEMDYYKAAHLPGSSPVCISSAAESAVVPHDSNAGRPTSVNGDLTLLCAPGIFHDEIGVLSEKRTGSESRLDDMLLAAGFYVVGLPPQAELPQFPVPYPRVHPRFLSSKSTLVSFCPCCRPVRTVRAACGIPSSTISNTTTSYRSRRASQFTTFASSF